MLKIFLVHLIKLWAHRVLYLVTWCRSLKPVKMVCKYVSTFTDTYSRFTMLKLLKSKLLLHTCTKYWSSCSWQFKQENLYKKLISDNGLECDNQFVKKLTVNYGIRHVFNAKYTPSQNGSVNHIQNLLGRSALTMKSPYELFYNKKHC